MEKAQLNDYPIMLSAKEAQKLSGFSRSMIYRMLNQSDMPVACIGGRKFLHRELFVKWLEEQATTSKGA